MNDNKKLDDRLLSILRNRPEKEPDVEFVQQLRIQLTEENPKKQWRWPNMKAALTVCVSLIIVYILGFTFSTELQQAMNLNEIQPENTLMVKEKGHQDEVNMPETDNPPEAVFKLSEDELKVYNLFKKDHNDEHLRGLPPVSIAKMFIQSRVDKNDETEYAFYTKREKYVQWTLEQHLEQAKDSNVNSENILEAFAKLGVGKFKLLEENVGVIEFEGPEYAMNFRMIKGEDGIWKVAFMPTQ